MTIAPATGPAGEPPPHVLLMPAPGEQHVFGLALVAEQFRRSRWTVSSSLDTERFNPVGWVAAQAVDVVGISVGSDARAAELPGLCSALRRASYHRGLSILVGGPCVSVPDAPWVASALGADGVARDARGAVALARRMVTAARRRPRAVLCNGR
jgi:methylmalonyl-CoA mutase cobalamin-binding subunit